MDTIKTDMERATLPCIAFAVLSVAAFTALMLAFYPGLLISDAMTGYSGAVRGYVDDAYGIFWNVVLIALAKVSGSPVAASMVQAGVYIVLCAILLKRISRGPTWVGWLGVILLLSPVFLVSAFYQHRDTAFALAFLGLMLALMRSQGRFDLWAVFAATLCCLFRPDFLIAYAAGGLVMARTAWRCSGGFRHKTVLLWMIAPVFAVLFRVVMPDVTTIAARGDGQKVSLTVQPVCAVVEETRAYDALPEPTRNAIEVMFPRQGLEERCAIRNIWIFWSPDNRLGQTDDAQRKAYFNAVGDIISKNMPLIAGRGVAMHLSANGMGHEVEGFMDFLKTPETLEPQFASDLIDTSPRLDGLRDRIMPLIDATSGQGFSVWRAILMNSVPVIALLLLFHRFGRHVLLDAAVVMVVVRSATLLVAPSAQYAYHFPVHLAGTALLLWVLAYRRGDNPSATEETISYEPRPVEADAGMQREFTHVQLRK